MQYFFQNYSPSDTFGWEPSLDVLGRSNKLACDNNSVAIKCKTDNTSYQALDMAVSCKCRSHQKRKEK